MVAGVIAASTGPNTEVAAIDQNCAEVYSLSQEHEPAQIFAEFSDAYDPKAPEDWRLVPDRKTLEQAAETTFPYTQAYVWSVESGTFIQMVFSSPSGDSIFYVDSCFDPTGALRRTESTFNTFNAIDPDTQDGAPISRITTRYYSRTGGVLETTTAVLDLKSHEPVPQRQFMDQRDPVFMNLKALPFSELMNK